jgi:hypothetical protein
MPTIDEYLPKDVCVRLCAQFARAVLYAAISELERADGRILPGEPPPAPAPRQPARPASSKRPRQPEPDAPRQLPLFEESGE